jgi:hypothetical protein
MTSEIDHALNLEFVNLQERQDSILQGSVSRKYSLAFKAKPLKNLKREELEQELSSRGIYDGKKQERSSGPPKW